MGSHTRPFRRKAKAMFLYMILFSFTLILPADSRSREKEGRRRNDRLSASGSQAPTYNVNAFGSVQHQAGAGGSEEQQAYYRNGYGVNHPDDGNGDVNSYNGHNMRIRNNGGNSMADKYGQSVGGGGGSAYSNGRSSYGAVSGESDGLGNGRASGYGDHETTAYGGNGGGVGSGHTMPVYSAGAGATYSSGNTRRGSTAAGGGGGGAGSGAGTGSSQSSATSYGSVGTGSGTGATGSYTDRTANANAVTYQRSGYIGGSTHSSYSNYNSDGHISAPKSYSVTKYSTPGTYITGSAHYNIEADIYNDPPGSQANDPNDFAFIGPYDPTGLCTRRRDMKLMCYCTPDENHVPVRKTECWVFSNELTFNDTTWTRFFQHKRMRDMKIVVQNHGHLSYIPTAVLKVLRNLTSILIEYSQLEKLPGHAFANLQYVEIIILTNNLIRSLEQNCFANHVRLRELNLENNKIKNIDRFAFRNLPSMERLHMNTNQISSIAEGCFIDMPHLIYLNLAGNLMTVLTRDIFVGLGNLNVLIVSNNKINFIGDTIFTELWSLNELDLSNNRIHRISERALDGMNNLRSINLRNNNLVKIDVGILRGTPALLAMNLQHNKLITLNYLTFQPIMDNLINSSGELQLSNNNFVCDCRLQWVFELKNRTQHNPLRESLDELVCTLQEPSLSHFERPVPSHIMDLLTIGGYDIEDDEATAAIGSTSTTTIANTRTAQHKYHNQIAQLQSLVADEPSSAAVALAASNVAGAMMKRSIVVEGTRVDEGDDDDDGAGVTATTALELDTESADYQMANVLYENNFMKIRKFRDDYDEIVPPVASALRADDLDSSKPAQLNGGDTNELLDYETTEAPIIFTGIKVRLFTLKSENLPCPDDVLDPTELPLSRDLMDVRTSNGSAVSLLLGANGRMTVMVTVVTMATLVCCLAGIY